MSFHTITMFVRWAVMADEKTIEFINDLRKLSLQERLREPRIIPYVEDLRKQWASGTKIEKLATLGWIPRESETLLCNVVENIEHLRKEYEKEVKKHGGIEPPNLKDEDVYLYEEKAEEERQKFKKKL
jgi:hypothetical protein